MTPFPAQSCFQCYIVHCSRRSKSGINKFTDDTIITAGHSITMMKLKINLVRSCERTLTSKSDVSGFVLFCPAFTTGWHI